MGELFGTDGIRGRVNSAQMDAETALRIGMAAGRVFTRGDHTHRVVIGKDTRLSGYMIETALTAGFTSVGMDVFLLGPLPTPAVAMLTRSLRADLGVMISASHNPFYDNGIKLFGPDGFKLKDEAEFEIERLMKNGLRRGLAAPDRVGRAKRVDDAQARYIEFAKSSFPKDLRLDDIKIVVDCANGAAYSVAPTVLWELGAEVIAISNKPNGVNINQECGSTSPERLRAKVLECGADIGVALDGDADRLIVCDERGTIIDGDAVLGLVATQWHGKGRLSAPTLVGTVMSNLALEHYLQGLGIGFMRTKVGDRHVVEAMRRENINVGGEPSGHIILGDYNTTGDGLIAALQVLSCLLEKGKPLSETAALFDPYPQLLLNVPYMNGSPLEQAEVQAVIKDVEQRMAQRGRIVVRKSGTEPLIRVMAEGDNAGLVDSAVREIVSVVSRYSGQAAAE